MVWRWLRAVLLLPGVVLVGVPAALLFGLGAGWPVEPPSWTGPLPWLGLAAGLPGALFAVWSALLFGRHGEGTAAPWDPPTRLVVRGPYRHVRNPMISGVCALLLAEALLLGSGLLAGWFAVFTLGNASYLPLVEEPGLLRRFGEDYAAYRRAVPRWIPRLRPWTVPQA